MSTALVEHELERFLESTEPEVLCIHGKWGVGKTFLWNQLLRSVVAKSKVGLGWCSYVSLFGITSLDDLKLAIAENVMEVKDVSREEHEPIVTKDNIVARLTKWSRKSAPSIARFGGKDFAAIVERLAYLSVTKTLVCFDDLERKGDGLAMKDLLGLIAQLKEQKMCKIVLLLNDDALTDQNKEEFERLKEKVIDESIEFAPDASDCARIALSGNDPATQLLRERVIELGISNIRIIKKIERLVSRAVPLIQGLHPRVLHQAIHSLALLGWSAYGSDGVPDLKFLLEKRGKVAFDLGDGENIPENEKRWNELLDRYGFSTADEFDLALLDGIRRGFFDDRVLKERADRLNEMFNAADGEKTLEAAWQPFHDSFATNDEEVIDGILGAFRDNVQRVSPGTLNSTMRILKETGHAERATEALRYYLEKRQEPAGFYDLSRYAFGGDIDDPDLRAAFEAKYQEAREKRSPSEILLHIYENDSWSEDDMEVLADQTADDFYAMFKEQHGEDLSRIIRTVLQLGRIQGDGEGRRRAISEQAKNALERIGQESPLNRLRVRKFGIRVEKAERG